MKIMILIVFSNGLIIFPIKQYFYFYSCELCKYSTDKRFNYDKHVVTNKHMIVEENIRKQHMNTTKTTETTEKVVSEFACKYCDIKFSFRQSMNRHIKYNCSKNKDEDFKKQVLLLKKQLDEHNQIFTKMIDEQTQLFTKMIDEQNKQIDELSEKLTYKFINE